MWRLQLNTSPFFNEDSRETMHQKQPKTGSWYKNLLLTMFLSMVDTRLCNETIRDLLQIFPTETISKILHWLDLPCLCLCRRVSKTWKVRVNQCLKSVGRLDFVPYESILTEDGLNNVLRYVSNLQVLQLDAC